MGADSSSMMSYVPETPFLSVIVPAFNEEANIEPLLARLLPVLERITPRFEVLFVDDGSRDGTWRKVRAAHERDPRIRGIAFSRNFGKEVALAAGLRTVVGDAAVIIDADLQHPPEVIADFVAEWRQGFRMVYGERNDLAGKRGYFRRKASELFYSVFLSLGDLKMPDGAGDFRLLDRRVIDALNQMQERTRFTKGLFAWVGFETIGVPFVPDARAAGESKFNLKRLFWFAIDGLAAFSTVPLRMWVGVGVLIAVVSVLYAIWFAIRTLLFGADVPGFPSLIVAITFFSGVQLISMGVLGEYIARIYAEAKGRPLYLVRDEVGVPAPVLQSAPPVAR